MTRSVVITGAGTGIGLGTAQRLARAGWRVFGSVRSQEAAARFQADVGPQATPLIFDVTDEAAVRAGAAQVAQALGQERLAGLVNNAGVAVPGPLLHLEPEELRRQMEVNIVGVHQATQAFAPLLGAEPDGASQRQGPKGRIVMISSVGGRNGAPFIGAYAASKHALEGYSESLRRELLVYGVDVLIVAPGAVATPIWDKAETAGLDRFANTPYGPIIAKFQNYMLDQGRKGLPPEAIGALIERLLTSAGPPVRTTILRNKFMANTLPSLLPKRMVDGFIGNALGLKARK
jgi:NAD(P)-dependent dehydrogenase (short-subunit alcohol dehydrogenase family)